MTVSGCFRLKLKCSLSKKKEYKDEIKEETKGLQNKQIIVYTGIAVKDDFHVTQENISLIKLQRRNAQGFFGIMTTIQGDIKYIYFILTNITCNLQLVTAFKPKEMLHADLEPQAHRSSQEYITSCLQVHCIHRYTTHYRKLLQAL